MRKLLTALALLACLTPAHGDMLDGPPQSPFSAGTRAVATSLPLMDPKAGRFVPLLTGVINGVTCNTSSPFNCVQFGQYKGNQILINGAYVTIPIGGIVGVTGGVMAALTQACIENSPPTAPVCGQSLAFNTNYYVYDKLINGVQTLVFSTSAYAVYTSPFGNAVMNGDPSASLVGLLHTDNSTVTFAGNANQQNSASWFNPVWDGLTGTPTGTFNSPSYVNLGGSGFLSFVQFSDNVPTLAATCVLNQNSGGTVTAGIGIGLGIGGLPSAPAISSSISVETGNVLRQVAVNAAGAIGTEGFIIATLMGQSNNSVTITPTSCTIQSPSRDPS